MHVDCFLRFYLADEIRRNTTARRIVQYVTTKLGITGVIECPTIDINEIGDGGIQYRSIRLILKLTSVEHDYHKVNEDDDGEPVVKVA